MAGYDASVKKALTASQQDLIDHGEHCSADPEKLATVGRALGHQVRIRRSNSQYALFTVSEVRQETRDNIVRMGDNGRKRLGTSNEFAATLDAQVPHPTFSDAEAKTNSEFVERLDDDGANTGLVALAPHGGDIERFTDQQAERVAARLAGKGVSVWRCRGFKAGGGAFDRWHITATEIHEASFPRLGAIISRGFAHAVAFHGFDDPQTDVLIGGAASGSMKEEIRTAVNGALAGSGMTVRIATAADKSGGDNPQNIVNRLTAGGANGIQLEQSLRARTSHWQDIADAVADVYRRRLVLLHSDPLRSAAHRSMFAHLSGPFTGGAVETRLTIDAAGEARVDWRARLPLLLIAPRQAVGAEALACTVRITQSTGETIAPVDVRFAPYTEAGAAVLAYRPGAVSMQLDFAAPFQVRLDPGGGGGAAAAMRDRFELRVVEGNMARLLYVIGSEKMRLRRQANEFYAMRRLAAAQGDVLDRLGAELGVPRFAARLSWDATLRTPTIVPEREADTRFRARLGIYRPFLRSSRRAAADLINGPGAGNNSGLPAQLGVMHRLAIAEPDTELLAAVRLVSSPDDAPRIAFLDYARQALLLQPGVDVPDTRLLPGVVRAEENALRARLAQNLEFPAAAFVAPILARALDRIGACRHALGVTRRWRVLRAQDDAGGSRYELGLGADVETIPPAELDTLAANHRAGSIAAGSAPAIRALLAQMQPRSSTDDPLGRWLLAPCGLTTVHPLDAAKTYVSHLALHGLVIGKNLTAGRTLLDARWNAPLDSGPDALLVLALLDADARRAAAGIAPWTLLTGAQERAAWGLAVPPPDALVQSVNDARIHMVQTAADVSSAKAALQALPSELIATLQLDAALAAKLVTHEAAAAQSLLALIIAFQRSGFISVLPLFTSDNRVLLVLGVTVLPGDATLLTARSKNSFRWFLMPLSGEPGELERKIGSRNGWSAGSGLCAVVVVVAGRQGTADPRGRIDPLEVRVALPDGALVSLEQYEFLMNLLDRARPLGAVVDTRGIRDQIDADGNGTAETLSANLSRTFRPYRQLRQVGASGT